MTSAVNSKLQTRRQETVIRSIFQ